jgi:hypothetical protein
MPGEGKNKKRMDRQGAKTPSEENTPMGIGIYFLAASLGDARF